VADGNAAFVGDIPGNYDRYLGPILFHQFADDLAGRLHATPGMRVLADAATGLIEGNPILGAIMERRPEARADIKRATAAAVVRELGDPPARIPLHAIVFSAHRPGL
jgi:hypothetical protein